jgi:hypothetical protein
MQIIIPFNTPSSKNSKIATSRGVFHSKQVRQYLQKLGVKKYSVSKRTVENYKTRPNLFEKAVAPMREALRNQKTTYLIGFHFVRKSKHKFDIINAMELIQDLLVAHQIVSDDNADFLIPIPIQVNGLWYSYSKDKPGVYLFVLSEKNIQGLKYVIKY